MIKKDNNVRWDNNENSSNTKLTLSDGNIRFYNSPPPNSKLMFKKDKLGWGMMKPAKYITFEFQYLHPEQNIGTNEWGIRYRVELLQVDNFESPIFSAGKGNNGIVYLDADDMGDKIAKFINKYPGTPIMFMGAIITHNGEFFRKIGYNLSFIKRIELLLDKNKDLHDGKIRLYDKNGHIQYV